MDSKIERKGKRVIMTLTFETKKEARADFAEKIAVGNEVYVATGPTGLHHVLVDDATLSRLQTPPSRPRPQTANEADRPGGLTPLREEKPLSRVHRRILHPGTRANVLDLIRKNPDGLRRSELLDHLHLRGNLQGEKSVSNALSALAKAGKLIRQDGKYMTPTPRLAAAG